MKPYSIRLNTGSGEIHKHGQVLIVPHPDLKNSFGAYLCNGETKERKSGNHQPEWTLEEWKMTITEVPKNSVSIGAIS